MTRGCRPIAVGVWIVGTLLAAGCAAHPAPVGKPAGQPSRAVLVDADPDGAVLLDRAGHYVGVTRDGVTAWREPAGVRTYSIVSCLARCPDATLSASLDATDSATAADPRRGWSSTAGGGRWTR